MTGKKPLPPTWLLASIVALALLHFVVPVFRIAPYPWNLVGFLPLAFGVYLNLSADAALKTCRTTVKPFEDSRTLVTTGVYRISRHPMYLGMVCIVFGIAVFSGSFTPLLVAPALALLLEQKFVRPEEAMLEKQFGSEWSDYRRRVRKWI